MSNIVLMPLFYTVKDILCLPFENTQESAYNNNSYSKHCVCFLVIHISVRIAFGRIVLVVMDRLGLAVAESAFTLRHIENKGFAVHFIGYLRSVIVFISRT